MKNIAVLTSGGDAPGMNAAIRAVVRTAYDNGISVYGVERGYKGLISDCMYKLDIRHVSDKIHRGGTMLYSARCPEFLTVEGQKKALEVCRQKRIEALIVIGGDGSFRGAKDFSELGMPCICIPGTIDNDIACSDYTIGYDTCMNTIMQMVDRVRDTTEAHDRCSVVEVMGNNAGHLALNAGIAVGATAILIPEVEFDIDRDVIGRIRQTQKTGKRHFIVMISEKINDDKYFAQNLASMIEEKTGIESRAVVLGHVQRGGSPSVRDRVIASQMGHHAIKLLADSKENRVIAVKDSRIVDYSIKEALQIVDENKRMGKTKLSMSLYNTALEISI